MCEHAKAKKSSWRQIGARYEMLLPEFEALNEFDARFDGIMEETERRVAAGEDPDEVRRDIEARFNLPSADG